MTENVIPVPLEEILEPEAALRASIDMEKIRELAESIRESGQLQPALLRPKNNKFEIVYGHRRFLACKLLGKNHLMAEIRDLTDEECLILRATENLQREDLLPMEEAAVYGTLRDKLNYTIEDIARKMGKNRRTIKQYLKLLELPEEFRTAINNKTLGIAVANILMEIDDPLIRNYYLKNAVEHGCSEKTALLWRSDYEATKENRYYLQGRGEDTPYVATSTKPVYYACDLCLEPAELSQIKHIAACPSCAKKIRLKDV